jgi:hypothetical protein
VHAAYALRADGGLGEDEGEAGSRAYIALTATFLLVAYQLGDSVRAAYARVHLRAPALHGQLDGFLHGSATFHSGDGATAGREFRPESKVVS